MRLSIDTRYIAAIDVTFSYRLLVSIVIISAYEFIASHTKRSICITLNIILHLYMYITSYTWARGSAVG